MWEVRVTPAGDFDNHAFKSNHFEVVPLSAAMGAEVVGVRLPELSDEAFEQFKQALYRHKMLYLRDQHLTHAEHEEFGARLGLRGRCLHPGSSRPPRGPSDHQGSRHESRGLFGGGWHTDSPFLAEPPAITTLRAVEIPPFGGDTSWANCALAFRHLSKTYQDMLRPRASI